MTDQESQQNEILESRLEESMADVNEPTATPSNSASPMEGVSLPPPTFEIYRGLFPQGSGLGSQATVQRAFQPTGTSLGQFLYPSQGQTSFNSVQGIQGRQYRNPVTPFPFPQDTPSRGEHAQQQNLTAASRLFPQPPQGSTPRASAVPPLPALYRGKHHARLQKIPRADGDAAQPRSRSITRAFPWQNRVPPRPQSTKRHRCPTCMKYFLQLSALEAHKKTHTVERVYPCPFPACIRHQRRHWFSVESNLKRHIASEHKGESRSADSEDVVMDKSYDEAEEAFAKLKI